MGSYLRLLEVTLLYLLCSVFFSGSGRVVSMVDHVLEVLNSNPTPAKNTFFGIPAVLKSLNVSSFGKSIKKMEPNCFCYVA